MNGQNNFFGLPLDRPKTRKHDDLADFTKGEWLNCEYEAEKKRKDSEYRRTPEGLLNTLNEESKKKQSEIDREKRKVLTPPPANHGTIKLLKDWENKYYHS